MVPQTKAGKKLVLMLTPWARTYPEKWLEGWEEHVADVENEAAKIAVGLQITDDHEYCDTQIRACLSILEAIAKGKAMSQLPHPLQDRIREAIKTREASR